MPIKINELIVQIKVHDEPEAMHLPTQGLAGALPTAAEAQRWFLAQELLELLEVQEPR